MSVLYDGANTATIHPATSGNFEGTGFAFCWRQFLTAVTANDEFIQRFTSAVGGLRMIATTTGTMTVTIGAAANIVSSANVTYKTDQWQHFMVAYDGGGAASSDRLRLFVDGVATSFATLGVIPATIVTPSSTRMIVGSVTAGRAPTGAIADIMYWNHNVNQLPDAVLQQQWAHYKPLIYRDTAANGPSLLMWFPYDDQPVTSSVGSAGINRAAEYLGVTGVSSNNLSSSLSSAAFGLGSDVGLQRRLLVV